MIRAITRAVRLLDVMSSRGALPQLLTSAFFSVSSFKLAAGIEIYAPKLGTVIDAGGNQGQFALAARHRFPEARIYSYEPVPDIYRQLEKNTRAKRIRTFNCALGSSSGELSFFQYQYGHVSSALEMHPDNIHPKYIPDGARQLKVPSRRLDDVWPELDVVSPVLLKMDVQGFEKEVLIGAEGILHDIDWVVTEVAFSTLYKNQPLFTDIHAHLEISGFELVAPLDFNIGANSRIIEMDVLYRRRVS